MDLKELYYSIDTRIKKVNFNELWQGFAPLKFALYNENECFFNGNYIEKTNAFVANTSILYEGEYIAVWKITDSIDEDILTSCIIHEMFHAFQKQNGESRFPDEMEAPLKYQYHNENMTLKAAENRLIAKLMIDFSLEDYQKLLKYRKYRSTHYPYEYGYESSVEQIEGSASYVELASLKQLNPEKYKKHISELLDKIQDPEKLFPVRILSYEVGALLFILSKEHSLADFEFFSEVPFTQSMLEAVADEETLPINPEISDIVESFFAQIKKDVDLALSDGELIVEHDCRLLSANIYDAKYMKPYLLSRYFVLYEDSEGKHSPSGDFVIEIEGKDTIKRIWRTNFTDNI